MAHLGRHKFKAKKKKAPEKSARTLRARLPATGVIWALRAQSRKKVLKMSPWALSAPGVQKVQNGVENESKSTIFQLFRLVFDSVLDFLGPGSRGPGDSFSDVFSDFGPEGPKAEPCSRQTGSQRVPLVTSDTRKSGKSPAQHRSERRNIKFFARTPFKFFARRP